MWNAIQLSSGKSVKMATVGIYWISIMCVSHYPRCKKYAKLFFYKDL